MPDAGENAKEKRDKERKKKEQVAWPSPETWYQNPHSFFMFFNDFPSVISLFLLIPSQDINYTFPTNRMSTMRSENYSE